MSILAKMTANLTDLIIKLRSFPIIAIKAPGLRRDISKNLRKVIAEPRWPRRSGTGPPKIVGLCPDTLFPAHDGAIKRRELEWTDG